jgi:hypothetical protein
MSQYNYLVPNVLLVQEKYLENSQGARSNAGSNGRDHYVIRRTKNSFLQRNKSIISLDEAFTIKPSHMITCLERHEKKM